MECIAHNATRASVLADRVVVANSMLTRLRGLLGTRELPRRHGLLLRPCRQVHSFFMQYALDLIFMDDDGHVLHTVEDFARNRMSPMIRAAVAVLELPAGTLAETPTLPGDVVHVEPRETFRGERD